MTIKNLTEKAAELIAKDTVLAGVPVIVEDKGDVANALALAIARRRLAIVVAWSGFTSDGNSSRTIFGKSNLVVSVFEQPVLNRRSPNFLHLLHAAARVAYALNLVPLGDDSSPLVFKSIASVLPYTDGGENSTVFTNVVFETAATL